MKYKINTNFPFDDSEPATVTVTILLLLLLLLLLLPHRLQYSTLYGNTYRTLDKNVQFCFCVYYTNEF